MNIEERLPSFFISMLKEQYGEELTKNILEGYSVERKVTLRANTLKIESKQVEKVLKENEIEFEKPVWSNDAFIINNAKENEIQKLDIYENGEIYLQSLSSMLPPIILEPKENTDILDMRKLSIANGLTPPIDGEKLEYKRCYMLRFSTLKKLEQIKAMHPDIIYISSIVDMAINHYFHCLFDNE